MKRLFLMAFFGLIASLSRAALLYDLSLPNPPIAYANLGPNVTMMDDVLIPASRLNGAPRISATKLETKIYVARPGTYTFKTWIAKGRISGGVLQPEFPLTQLTTNTFTAQNANQIYPFTIGDGTRQIFSLPLLPFEFEGSSYGMFFFGMSFSNPLSDIGWVLADRPDTNLNGFYGYYGPGDSRNGPIYLDGYRSSFNLKLTGEPVPEPSILAAALLAPILMRRRTRRL